MAKITWTFKNEEGTNLNRYIATNISTGEKITFDLLRGGNISVVGTPLNAENLNALITSINACYDLITSSEKDTTYTLSKNGNAIRLTASNGKTNDVTLGKSDVGLGNVDNTSDMDKPISNATQTELNKKANTIDLNSHINNTNNPHNVNKAQVGLGNVDNTSDADKPISNATQQALDLKANASEVNAKIDEVKQEFENHIVECNCTHEVEITGFGEEDCNLAIDDQDVVITKIQGQTRRKSLNLINIADVSETTTNGITYSIKNGVITLNGTASDNINLSFNFVQKIPAGYYSWKFFSGSTNLKFDLYFNLITFNVADNDEYSNYYFNENLYGILFYIPKNTSYSNYVLKPMLVSGTTAPTYFEPYDNTLVNSKCDFISTGRNLFDKDTATKGIALSSDGGTYNNSSYFTSDYIYLIPNTYIVMNFGNGWYNLYDNQKNYVKQATTTKFTITQPMYIRFSVELVYIDRFMLNYGDTALPYEPYVEDTMQCGIELGAFDYHDNVNHITHRQTSGIITLNGSDSENWVYNTDTNRFTLNASKTLLPNLASTSNINIVNDYIRMNANYTNVIYTTLASNDMCYSFSEGGYLSFRNSQYTDVSSWKSYLQANPITFVYKLATETTEENILPSGYKVWYKGMQIQKTDTIPYILTKQYAISLASQVLNNVSIDRSQQKQIDELKEKKANYSDVYKKSETYSKTEVDNKFGGFLLSYDDNGGTIYYGDSKIIETYNSNLGYGTFIGNEDNSIVLIGAGTRPKYSDGGTPADIALISDISLYNTSFIAYGNNIYLSLTIPMKEEIDVSACNNAGTGWTYVRDYLVGNGYDASSNVDIFTTNKIYPCHGYFTETDLKGTIEGISYNGTSFYVVVRNDDTKMFSMKMVDITDWQVNQAKII